MEQITYASDLGLHISDVPAQLGFVLAFPYPASQKNGPLNRQKKPTILTFRSNKTTIGQLMSQYKPNKTDLKDRKRVSFQLSNGSLIKEKVTLASLCKKLRVVSIDSLVLYTENLIGEIQKVNANDDDSDQSSQGYIDECAMQEYGVTYKESQDDPCKLHLNFKLPNSDDMITISTQNSHKIATILNNLHNKIQEYFDIDIGKMKVKYTYPYNNKIKDLVSRETTLQNIEGLNNWTTINMEIKEKLEFKRKILNPNNRLIIYQEDGEECVTMLFQEIQFMTFRNIYKSKLAPENKVDCDQTFVSLKVMDIIIGEDENLTKISQFYKINQEKTVINLVGRVVSEKMIFYKTMKEIYIEKGQNFQIKEHIISSDKNEQRSKFQQRHKKDLENRAKNAELEHFQNINNVQPLFIYTCQQIHHKYSRDIAKSQPVYLQVNKTLRLERFLKKNKLEIQQDWRYMFTSSLISQLKKITSYETTKVFRGVDYDPKVKENDIYTFRSFTSTSLSQEIASGFFKKNPDSPNHTLFEMKISSGKSINRFSKYAEEELLLEPYTQFRVIEVETTIKQYLGKTITFRRVVMQQLTDKESSIDYPQSIANFIIWIDDKKFEGEEIYKNIKVFQHPTILIQLSSNSELEKWLDQPRTKKVFEDKTANIVYITNMTRGENGLAGIEGIVTLQKSQCHMEIPIFMYIGNIELARQKLNNHKQMIRNFNNIKVDNRFSGVEQFLKREIQIDFQDKSSSKPPSQMNPEQSPIKNKVSTVQKGVNPAPIIKKSKSGMSNASEKNQKCLLI